MPLKRQMEVIMIVNVKLTTKEKFLLEDAKTHEENCIKKYSNYAQLACDAQLKSVFRANGQKEEEHLQTINQLLSGQVPSMNQGGQSSQQQSGQSKVQSQQASIDRQSSGQSVFQASDKELCTDMLMTEKYVSGSYNTAIFEFKDTQIRDVLNHIQKEEQKHGEAIFAYMQSKGMYSPS
jgi:spore coat protein CotF